MKYIKSLVCVIFSLFLQACPGEPDEDPDATFSIKNNSDENIYVYYNTSSSEIAPNYFAVQPTLIINIAGSWEDISGRILSRKIRSYGF